jgi:hypothetical protein
MLDSEVIILEYAVYFIKTVSDYVSGKIKHYISFWRTRDREGSGTCFKGGNGGNIRVNEFTVALRK